MPAQRVGTTDAVRRSPTARRKFNRDIELRRRRIGLFRRFRTSERYRNAILQDLWPLFSGAYPRTAREEDLGDARGGSSWFLDILGFLADRPDFPLRHQYKAYADKVWQFVGKELRLTDASGLPLEWACELVHADIASRLEHEALSPVVPVSPGEALAVGLDYVLVPDHPTWQRVRSALIIEVTPAFAHITRGARAQPCVVAAAVPLQFNEWDELRDAAHQALDRQIDRLQRRFDTGMAQERLNSDALRRTADGCSRFARYLLNREEPIDAAEREMLRRFAQSIGVAFPALP